ncbi:hypothetical protein IC235_17345 [Hymenobacter sp. BT664]|uniref:Carboxypeptidase regulatory-like domain-containing protein n=1 Tax=Hymenobacter montanus TaxID=2771359 RepID=A0A927GKJ6_9BACT|nr:DUF6252 family protein [Hymenobacter montanus]MBD2769658.1 hypothetical protein [Hymenobacter montanus]
MNTYLRYLALCLLASSLLTAVSCSSKKDDPQAQPPATVTATLSGQVSPAGSIATVTATDANGKAITATPNRNGTYSFPGLPLGSYTLTFTPAAGYIAPTPASAALVAGGTVVPTTTVVAAPTTATLSGQVDPVGSVTTVTATPSSGRPTTTTPGSTGAYSLPNLPFGEYTISFTAAPGYQAITTVFRVTLVVGGTTVPTVTATLVPTSASYSVNGTTVTPVNINSQVVSGDRVITLENSANVRLTLFLQGQVPTVGRVQLNTAANYAQYNAADQVIYSSRSGNGSSTLDIDAVNTTARTYSGTFRFVAGITNPTPGSPNTRNIANGTFTNLRY